MSIWKKSSFSTASGNNCVEVAPIHKGLTDELCGRGVRNSKDPKGAVLVFTEAEWAAFVAGVKAEEFD